MAFRIDAAEIPWQAVWQPVMMHACLGYQKRSDDRGTGGMLTSMGVAEL